MATLFRIKTVGVLIWDVLEMEMAGRRQADKSPQKISQVVHKVGTNRHLAQNRYVFSVTFFSEPYDFIPSLLASIEASPSLIHSIVALRRKTRKYNMVPTTGLEPV